MTSIEFYLLPADQKADYIHKHGVFVGKIKNSVGCRLMYQVKDFYAEVTYHSYRRIIKHIKVYNSTDVLDAYLSQIPLNHLIDCFS